MTVARCDFIVCDWGLYLLSQGSQLPVPPVLASLSPNLLSPLVSPLFHRLFHPSLFSVHSLQLLFSEPPACSRFLHASASRPMPACPRSSRSPLTMRGRGGCRTFFYGATNRRSPVGEPAPFEAEPHLRRRQGVRPARRICACTPRPPASCRHFPTRDGSHVVRAQEHGVTHWYQSKVGACFLVDPKFFTTTPACDCWNTAPSLCSPDSLRPAR